MIKVGDNVYRKEYIDIPEMYWDDNFDFIIEYTGDVILIESNRGIGLVCYIHTDKGIKKVKYEKLSKVVKAG